MAKEKYTQCGLSKGNLYQVSWIPSSFAKVGKIVDLKEKNSWDKGWLVEQIWSTITVEELRIAQKQEKNTRKASDI